MLVSFRECNVLERLVLNLLTFSFKALNIVNIIDAVGAYSLNSHVGKKVIDKITKKTGTCLGVATYLYSSPRFLIALDEIHDEKNPLEETWVDAARFELLGPSPSEEAPVANEASIVDSQSTGAAVVTSIIEIH